jgi:hypothetical protein
MSSRVIPGHFKAGLIPGVPPKVYLAIDFLEHFIQRPCTLILFCCQEVGIDLRPSRHQG